ncbi:MAG: CHAT domain-containing protein [Jatrophihabitans sp.]|uniref:CHAT domain-containing protein n=1 Tax=Jatrophihabitans sp. TaxID=1932789 RepID=UPI003914E64B
MAVDVEDGLSRARRVHAKAVTDGRFGHAARAIRGLNRALTIAEQADVPAAELDSFAAEVWLTLAVIEAEVHGVERGLQAIAEAARRAGGIADPALKVRVHSNHGFIASRAGKLDLAMEQLQLALAMIDHATPHDRFAILLNTANLNLYRGEVSAARGLLTRAAAVAEAEDLNYGRFMALHNLGYTEFLGGNLPAALAAMDTAARIDVDVSRGIWALDRARILMEAGLIREADDTLAEAARIFAADRQVQDHGEVEVARAECALASGDVAAARRFAGRARDRFRRRGNTIWTRTAELVLLQGDLAAGRPGLRLAPVAQRLATQLDADGLVVRGETAALIGVEALLAAGLIVDASAALERLDREVRNQPITAQLHSGYVHAAVDAASGRTTAASRRIRRTLGQLARYQASFGSIDLRTASAVHGRRLAELDITLALQRARPASVFAAAEQARAVTSRLPAVRPPDDPVAAELLAELRQTVEALRTAEHDKSLARKRRDLERRIVARSWTLTGTGAVERAASLDETRAGLADRGRTLISYVQAGGNLAAVTVGERSRLYELGPAAPVIELARRCRADLDVLAQSQLPEVIRTAVRASLQTSLSALDAALLGPLQVDGPLVIVSTGMLGQLAWASLPSLRGRSIVVAPSATKWLKSTTVRTGGPVSVTAVVGPDLGRGTDEASAVGAAWGGKSKILAGDRSSCAAFTSAMSSTTVLHVAAHGVHQPENPLFSSVRMVDGPVFAHELDRSARAPEHVVLSACEVGLATIRPGDEALGLASVLLHLGTRSVIAGVARVGDDIAADTMAAYHRKLAAGADSSAALAEALFEADTDVTPPFVNFGAAWAANLETASPVA